MYKESNYNFIYDDLGTDKVVFYNSRTGALAVVKESQHKQFTDYVSSGAEITDKDFFNNLLKCGYIVPQDVDERFLIKTRMMEGRYNSRLLSLTIAPTMACNFRCVYCFEQGHYGHKMMDDKTMEAIIEFVKNKLHGVETLRVTWFGGEPLLGVPVIERLTAELTALCQEKSIDYRATIITNGFLLTRDIAERLRACHVQNAQITVDGPREIHDSRRPLAGGGGTYETIMQNLCEVKDVLNITLRINVDYENMGLAEKVMDNLKSLDLISHVRPYLGLVISYNGQYSGDKCLSDEVYSKYNLEFMLNHKLPLQSIYPIPRKNYCCADFRNGWVIDDVGNLYKCWNDIGIPERVIGNLHNKSSYITKTDLVAQYCSFDPTNNEKCKDCNMLPVCLGGCPHSKTDGTELCEYRKYTMHEYLIECAKVILSSSRSAQN